MTNERIERAARSMIDHLCPDGRGTSDPKRIDIDAVIDFIELAKISLNAIGDWQPIDTAPKDGTEIDLWCLNCEGGERWCRARWEPNWEGDKSPWKGPWSDGFDSDLPSRHLKPTHWMFPPTSPHGS